MINSTLMVQGTTSNAGKSLMVAGLCRLLISKGVNVVPFKPQNMALNSAVTSDGGEIGRAQALQAEAACLQPVIDMNPILIKPESDRRAQVIVHGRALQSMDAQNYHHYKARALDFVLESFERLMAKHDFLVAEGAGSPAEINLRNHDIANMGFAEAVDCPVLLVADIDRGGVFATVVGTLDLLSESERERIVGIVINKFRGDIELLKPGLNWLEQRTGKPVLGVMPYLKNLFLDAEDAIDAEQIFDAQGAHLNVVVLVLPRISNHTDFDALRLHPNVNLRYISLQQELGDADLVILPGTKNVREDLAQLKAAKMDSTLCRHLRYGGKILGICGGLQMLGDSIADPDGIESSPGTSTGLGLLRFVTVLEKHKQLRVRSGKLCLSPKHNISIKGYEIHCGQSRGTDFANSLVEFEDGSVDGVISADRQIIGTYLHGLFDSPAACTELLNWAELDSEPIKDAEQQRDEQLNRLADTIEEHIDMSRLFPQWFCTEQRPWESNP
ncbi:MAG: cobyric acid synthase [Gammaproteobacteria bacterium]|nr:cobyric acid synthase [Gammaproteobacteria bacterium]MCY4357499.1 cobyric acid synthase [Gammaproteobacteria bacterium]